MDQKTTMEKLRILLPHWVEHNRNHEAEFKKWADLVRSDGQAGLAELLDKAVASMAETDAILNKALAEVGGTGEGGHQHDHDHDHGHSHGHHHHHD